MLPCSVAPKGLSAPPALDAKAGCAWNVGAGKWESSSKSLSAYEQKMMKRLERANRRAAYEAAGVPLPGAKVKSKEERPLPPPPAEGPDHERLAHVAEEARGKGDMFYYFPMAGETLKKDAVKLNKFMREEEAEDEALRERNLKCPEKGLYDFFERLEGMQQEQRRRQIERGEVEDPWKRPSGDQPAVSCAGKPHEVVVDTTPLDEDQGCQGDQEEQVEKQGGEEQQPPCLQPQVHEGEEAPLESRAAPASESQQTVAPAAARGGARRGPNASLKGLAHSPGPAAR
mmetsp:Transcript_101349/g.255354  ORF Transcript_101349/g.255354 Transcript_101349/m.255354 type:complete len:286 (+) Transcript_101349:63-920(+)